MNSIYNLGWLVGLGYKLGVCGKITGFYFEMPRCRDDPNRWPSVSDRRRQFQTLHQTRHIDVGKYKPNIGMALEHLNGFVHVGCLQNVESSSAEYLDRIHAKERFVFDNKNADWGSDFGCIKESS